MIISLFKHFYKCSRFFNLINQSVLIQIVTLKLIISFLKTLKYMAQKIVLGYWNIRGLAERARFLLEYLNVPYEQKVFTPETADQWFGTLKPQYLQKNAAANLPYLLDGDKVVCESNAIIVYICHKANRADLLGDNADDQVQVATVSGVLSDLQKAFYGSIYGTKTYEQFKDELYNSMKPHLTKFSGLLGQKDWFGSKLTWIDIVLGQVFQVYGLFHQNFAQDFPTLKAHQERVWQLEGISQYLKSDRFKQRPINWYPHAKWF